MNILDQHTGGNLAGTKAKGISMWVGGWCERKNITGQSEKSLPHPRSWKSFMVSQRFPKADCMPGAEDAE